MSRIKATFSNLQGESLAGLLEIPEGVVKSYALFAHCFTCSKNFIAATRITRAMAEQGIAVLRFDFTGLGNSDGDFSNTNFSSNIQDLICAAEFLETHYAAPTLLIGHSLGGAAVLAAAQYLPFVKAVGTIGAPATADHIRHLFNSNGDEIPDADTDSMRVNLGGRSFAIKRQFVDDLERHNSLDHIKTLKKALIIFHSPLDSTVSIDEAARIYTAARHPKSFISLDNADHLLSRHEDAEYVASIVSVWASRYVESIDISDDAKLKASPVIAAGSVVVREKNKLFTREVFTGKHRFLSDEPIALGGNDLGANPYELLLAALGCCTSMTLRMYANHKEISLQDIEVKLMHHRIHADDCEFCDEQDQSIDKITRLITLTGNLSNKQRARLIEIANRCPVHKTLENQIHIETKESP